MYASLCVCVCVHLEAILSQFVLGKGHTLVCMLMRVDTGISTARDTRVKIRRSGLVGVLPAATCRPPVNRNASSQTSFSSQSHSGPAIYGLCRRFLWDEKLILLSVRLFSVLVVVRAGV